MTQREARLLTRITQRETTLRDMLSRREATVGDDARTLDTDIRWQRLQIKNLRHTLNWG